MPTQHFHFALPTSGARRSAQARNGAHQRPGSTEPSAPAWGPWRSSTLRSLPAQHQLGPFKSLFRRAEETLLMALGRDDDNDYECARG